MKKVELLAPAKDLGKALIALRYGADAVYVGGLEYSLRSRASNFTLEDIKTLVDFAHYYRKKVYVTVNMVFHDDDLKGIVDYLKTLEMMRVDAVIIESLGLMALIKKYAPKLECHLSTQLSTTNSLAVEELSKWGADRIVLAREVDMLSIEVIAQRCKTPLEVFIHGGMCANYSGRCTLSNRMTNRDANRGGCAHSCRWNYHVYHGTELLSKDDLPFTMSSYDLRATPYIERMIKAGVASLKIEGRMKSDHYIAQVTRTYRKMIDEIEMGGHLDEKRLAYYNSELDKAENRPSDTGFLGSSKASELFGATQSFVSHEYVAMVKDFNLANGYALVEVRNKFSKGDTLEVFGPDQDNEQFIVEDMFDEDGTIEVANRPKALIWIKVPFLVKPYYMLRKVAL